MTAAYVAAFYNAYVYAKVTFRKRKLFRIDVNDVHIGRIVKNYRRYCRMSRRVGNIYALILLGKQKVAAFVLDAVFAASIQNVLENVHVVEGFFNVAERQFVQLGVIPEFYQDVNVFGVGFSVAEIARNRHLRKRKERCGI